MSFVDILEQVFYGTGLVTPLNIYVSIVFHQKMFVIWDNESIMNESITFFNNPAIIPPSIHRISICIDCGFIAKNFRKKFLALPIIINTWRKFLFCIPQGPWIIKLETILNSSGSTCSSSSSADIILSMPSGFGCLN